MTYIVATTRTHYEFATANAINDAGGFAVVPRRLDPVKDKQGVTVDHVYRPFLPNFIFLSVTEEQFYEYQTKRLFWLKPQREGDPIRTILPKMRRDTDILPRTWGEFQGFAERAERACELRLEQHEQGKAVARYRKGDLIRIMGDMLDGQLRDKLARFIRLDKQGRVEVEVEGFTLMGKPITATLAPSNVQGIAAE